MQIFAACVAFLPLAMYLLTLAWINSRPHAVVVGGGRETAALGLALAGPVLIGPAQLLLPPAATHHFGPWVWLLLASLYALAVLLAILVSRPRLVVYNITQRQLRDVLTELVAGLDADARWAGDSLASQPLGVELRIEGFAWLSSASLVANSDLQEPAAWHSLLRLLRGRLAAVPAARGWRGTVLAAIGGSILAWLAYRVAGDPTQTVQGMADLLGP